MTAFEVIKTVAARRLTLWESHTITIIFCALLVFVVSVMVLKKDQAEIRASTNLSDSLMESLPGAVCIFDRSGKVRRWNTNFLGYRPEEMIGEDIFRTVAEGDREATGQTMRSVFEHGAEETEARLVAKSGAVIPCYLKGVQIEFENEPCVLGIGIDLSKRKRAEEHVRLQMAALESAANGIVITNSKGTIEWVNRAFTELTGYTREEAVGQNPRILKSGKHNAAFYNELWSTVTSGKVWKGEVTNRRKDGQLYVEEMTIAPVRSEAGELTNFIAVKQEITERKHAQEQQARAKEAAESANVAKSEFLANMSHEIRTPMNGIMGMTDLMLETELTAEQREYLELVKGSADALLTIINDILDFSKIEAGKLTLENVSFDLRASLRELAKTLALKAQEKGVEFLFDVEPDVPQHVASDPGRLRQVLMNLVGNALKFTKKGEIELRARLNSRTGETMVLEFSVRDTGIGIPEDKRRSIFEAFAQGDTSTTRKYGGTGLGLAISTRLVSALGGRLWVESEVEKGSTFHFTVSVEGSEEPEALAPEAADLSGIRVLIVDDNAANRRLQEDCARRWKMIPMVAESAENALRLLGDAQAAGRIPEVMLTDAHMPEMDGFGLVERIRANGVLNEMRIVMLTSGGMRGDGARCRELGVGAYLSKPFDRLELREVLCRVLSEAGTASETRRLVTRHSMREQGKALAVLVAEDNGVNQKLIATLLEKRGHRVVVVKNGREALETLAKETFNVVLMDCQMPEMDGFSATAALREREQATGGHVPIIALTAHAMVGDRERCTAAGMDGYVPKPLRAEELFAAIEKLVQAERVGMEEAGERR